MSNPAKPLSFINPSAVKATIIAAGISLCQLTYAQTVLVNYSFGTANAACSSTPATATNVTCSASTSLTCLGTGTGTAVSTPTSFATNSTAGNSLGMRSPILIGFVADYFQFQLGGSMLNQYSGYKIFFNYNVDNSIGSLNLQYSTDGSSWTTYSSFAPSSSWGSASLDLTGVTALNFKSSVYFRIGIPLSLGVPTNIFDPYKYVYIDNFQVYSTCMAPQISALSPGVTRCAGSGISVGVSVTGGTIPYSYQWQKNSVNIPGGTTALMTVSSVALADSGNYVESVSNACATVSSNSLKLVVNPLPAITTAATAAATCFSSSPQSTSLSYSATTNTPDTYTITWDAASVTAGLTNVANTALPASSVTVPVAAGVAAGTYTGTLTVANSNGCVSAGTNFSFTINPAGQWIGGSSGDWNVAGNWCGGVPSASDNVIIPANTTVSIQSANAVANTVTISANGNLLMTGAYKLSVSAGGSFTNNGTFSASAAGGIVEFLGNGTVSGTTTFNNIDTYGALDFGAAGTVSGIFTLQTGGSVTGHSPFYSCPSATLLYKTGGTFLRGPEWATGSSGAGCPANVSIQNNTVINFPSAGQGYICNDLQIESGSSLRQDYSGGSAALQVGRNVTINGTLSLGSAAGGDIYAGGNWTRNAGGIFNANGRKVIFNGPSNFSGNGSAVSTITAPAAAAKNNDGGFGGESFAHLWMDKTNATDSVVLLSNISITKELGFTKGTFSLGNSDVTLVSNSSFTADIAPVATIADVSVHYGDSGRFVIQRFIQNPTAVRSWRLLTAPLQNASAPSINEAFMEGVVNPDKNSPNAGGGMYNPWPGYGTHITGPGGTYSATNGFDQGTNSASILYATAGVSGWAAPSSTISTKVTDEQGWMLFVRGDRSFVIGDQYTPAENATLEPKGKINTGDVSVPVVSGNQVIGNPYASAISLLNVDVAGTPGNNSTYYMWDPKMFTSYTQPGKWVTFTGVGSYFVQTTSESAYPSNGKIESGQAFVLHSAQPGNITFHESDKLPLTGSLVGISNGNAARPGSDPVISLFRTDVYVVNNGKYTLTDGVLNVFSESFSNAADAADARKFISFNTKECLSIKKDSVKLAIEKRSGIQAADTIFLDLSKFNQLPYQFRFTAENFSAVTEAFLEDKFTGSRWPISTSGATAVNFVITADPMSKASDRFRVLFRSSIGNVLPVTFTDIKATKINNNITVRWKTANELNIEKYDIERSADAVHFAKVHTAPSHGNAACGDTYSWLDENAAGGINYYRVAGRGIDGSVHYSPMAKASLDLQHGGISLFSNPVLNGIIKLRFTAMERGNYLVTVLNNDGQAVRTTQLYHAGGNATREIATGKSLSNGIYRIEVTKAGSEKITMQFIAE